MTAVLKKSLPSLDVLQWLRDRSRERGFYAELFLCEDRSQEAGWRNLELYDEHRGESASVSLRLLDASGREGLSHESGGSAFHQGVWDWEGLQKLWEESSSALKYSQADACRVAPLKWDANFKIDPLPEEEVWSAKEEVEARKFLMGLQAAKSKKCKTLRADFASSWEKKTLATSSGIYLTESGFSAGMSLTLMAEEGLSVQTVSCGMEGKTLKAFERDLPALREEAAREAEAMVRPKQISSGRYPVVFSVRLARDVVSLLADTFCADEVQKGDSPWQGRLGETIAASGVTLCDDARLKGALANSAWDDEGVATGSTVVLDGGVLKAFLYDIYTARVDGTCTTGNSSRGSSGAVSPGYWNFYLKPGQMSFKELLKETKDGLYLTELMGLHTIDAATGVFSLAASGFKIEKGEIKQAVNRFTVAGNLYDLLKNIDGIAREIQFHSDIASSAFRVKSLDIGGT